MDRSMQLEELDALKSIYYSEEFQVLEDNEEGNDGKIQAIFWALLTVPDDYEVRFLENLDSPEPSRKTVKFLPPIELRLSLPEDYPSVSPPNFTISSVCLSRLKITALCKKLDEIWQERGPGEIIYWWCDFLKNDALKFLDQEKELDLTYLCKKHLWFMKSIETGNGRRKKKTEGGSRRMMRKALESSRGAASRSGENWRRCGAVGREGKVGNVRGACRGEVKVGNKGIFGWEAKVENKGVAGGEAKVKNDKGAYGGEAKPENDKGACGREGKAENDKGAYGGEAKPENDKGACGGEANVKTDKGAYGGEAKPENDMGAYGGEAKPENDMGAYGGEAKPENDMGACGGEAKPENDMGACGGEAKPENDMGACGGEAKAENDMGACGGEAKAENDNGAYGGEAKAENDMGACGGEAKAENDKGACGGEAKAENDKGASGGEAKPENDKGIYTGAVRKTSQYKMNYRAKNKRCNSKHDGKYDERAVLNLALKTPPIRVVEDYDIEAEEAEFLRTIFTCNICLNDLVGSECTRFRECKHVFCKSCVRDYFTVRIREGTVHSLKCPEDKCLTEALPSQVKEIVSEDLFHKYDLVLLSTALDTLPDIIYCPRRFCQYPVTWDPEERMASCPNCEYVFCVNCKMVYHGIQPCVRYRDGEAEKLVKQYENANPEMKRRMEARYGKRHLQSLVDNIKAEAWIRENSKACPKCDAAIEKSQGCNKMVCWKCNASFCWLCCELLLDRDPYSHFREPNSRCANKLFHLVYSSEEEDDDDEWDWV